MKAAGRRRNGRKYGIQPGFAVALLPVAAAVSTSRARSLEAGGAWDHWPGHASTSLFTANAWWRPYQASADTADRVEVCRRPGQRSNCRGKPARRPEQPIVSRSERQ